MARVFGSGIRRGAKYKTIHPFDYDLRIVRLVDVSTSTAEDEKNETFKVKVNAILCRKIRSKCGHPKETINATVARVLGTEKFDDLLALGPSNESQPIRTLVGGIANIEGEYVDPNTVFKAIELCGKGLYRLEGIAEITQTGMMQSYEIKLPASLAKSIRKQFQTGQETLSEALEKVLALMLRKAK